MGILLYPLCLHIDNTYISIYLFFTFIRSLTYNCIQCLKASVINTSGSWPMASSFLFHIKLTLDISNIFLSTGFFFFLYLPIQICCLQIVTLTLNSWSLSLFQVSQSAIFIICHLFSSNAFFYAKVSVLPICQSICWVYSLQIHAEGLNWNHIKS